MVDVAHIVSLLSPFNPLSRTHDVHVSFGSAQGIVGTEVYSHLALIITFLGCDDYYTIGTTASIDGAGRCILQYLDALDVLRVEVDEVEVFVHRNAIYHEERI